MEELPILIGALEVGKVVIQEPTDAIRTARDSAFTISTTNDTRFCPFSDGSHHKDRGGVGLAYRRHWLPKEWAPEQPKGLGPSDDFIQKSWPYARSSGNMVMEGIGVLEGLHAANEAIRRDLHVLKGQNCTIMVRGTTDCEAILRHIARNIPTRAKAERTVPSQLIKRIKIEIQELSSHGVKVNVELHWCPRNKVLPLSLADKLAGRTMANGFGFTNVTQDCWVWGVKSDMTLDIEPLVCGAAHSDQTAEADEPPAAGPSTIGKSRKERKKERRRAARAVNVTTASENPSGSIPQLQLPSPPLPSKLAMNAPATKSPHTKSNAASSTDAQLPNKPATAEAAKRKVEEGEKEKEKENNEKAIKKAKSLPADEAKTKATAPTLPSNTAANAPATVTNTESTKPLDTKSNAASSTDAQLPNEPVTAKAVKRKLEEEEKERENNEKVAPWKFALPEVCVWETIPLQSISQEAGLREVIPQQIISQEAGLWEVGLWEVGLWEVIPQDVETWRGGHR